MSLDSSFNITLDSNDATFKLLGDEKLRITSLGNVGIGTTAPDENLHIHDSGTCYLKITSGSITGGFQLATVTSGDAFIMQYENRPLRINVNGQERMRINSNGNVGIGTTSPTQKLHVNGNISASTVYANLTGNVTGNVSGSSGSVSGSVHTSGAIVLNRNFGQNSDVNHSSLNNIAGNYFVKIGIDAGYTTSNYGRVYFLKSNTDENKVTVYANGFTGPSDDRLKTNELLITNATNTLMKLSPQIYEKYGNLQHTSSPHTESGLIAQDVWYNTPELRHIVTLPIDASGNDSVPLPLPEGVNTQQNIQQDIDYVSLGWSSNDYAGLNYIQLIPYLIKSNQEQQEEINTLKTQLTDVLTRLSALENN